MKRETSFMRFFALLLMTCIITAEQGNLVLAKVPERTLANPVHHCTKQNGSTDYTDFSYVYFGSYPQSEVTDAAAIVAIENAIAASGTAADAGIDVWINGTKYRRISKNNTNYDGYFDNVSTGNGYRYFKWERIKWRVLRNDGNTLFVAADKAIDCKSYNEEAANVTWETSTLRSWLNNSFYNTAFSSNEQSAIVAMNVVNENNQEYGTEGGNATNDKIYLLSISEVTDEKYGFCSDGDTSSISRRMKASDYANARGTLQSSSSGYEGNCWWWLRSPGFFRNYSANANYYGWLNRYGYNAINSDGGVCPSLHIKLSSDMWFTTDDGTSGEGGNGGADSRIEILKDLQAVKVKIEYIQGEALNLDDLTVTAVYENSSKVLPAGSYTTNVKTININTSGRKILTISYTEGAITKTVDIAIIITPKVDTVPQKADTESQVKNGSKIADKNSAGTYKVTNINSGTPTVEYTGTISKSKKTITIPEYITYQGVKYKVTGVSAKCFKGNKKLAAVKIASSVVKIGDSAFEGCIRLKTVTIGIGLKTIGKNAFKNCKKLETLTIKSNKLKTVGKNAFKGIYTKCKIKVPAKKVKAYTKLIKNKGQKATVKINK
ncbi:MAG: leucine-rich repeat domain-containing protein [Roseburia sp.]|nr:leucine-rich repeat domain-containing protein [Roseburia sp.]MCM1278566.1 leucine-rich repeat domain-containing protein [Robinsoniella sp.]